MSSYINDLNNNFNNYPKLGGKLSTKDTKAIGDLVCGKPRRKSMVTLGEISHMMAVREVYRAASLGETVCVVIPREMGVEEIFKEFTTVMKNKLKSGLVKITTIDNLTVDDLEMGCVEDFSGVV